MAFEREDDTLRRLRAIFDEAPVAIRIIDASTLAILDTNRLDCELSGCPRDEMLGRDARDFWPEEAELRAEREAALAEARTKGFSHNFGLTHRTHSGTLIRIDSAHRIVEFAGRFYEVVVFSDASPRLADEAARWEATELRAITALTHAAAHEINNPLTVILAQLELVAAALPKEGKAAWRLAQARTAAEQIYAIVARLTQIR